MKDEGLTAILLCALLIAVTGLHRATYYGTRSSFVLSASEAAEQSGETADRAEVGRLYGKMTQTTALAPLAGALVISLLGTRWALVCGGGLLLLAQLLFATGSVRSLAALIAFALAHGLIVTATPLLAGRHGGRGRRVLTLALFFGLYFAVNLGAFQGPILAGWVSDRHGYSTAFFVLGVLALVLLGAAFVAALVAPKLPPPPPAGDSRSRLLTLPVLAGVALLFWISVEASVGVLSPILQAAGRAGSNLSWFWSLSTLVVLMLSAVAAVLCLAANAARRVLPSTPIWVGSALVFGAVSTLLHGVVVRAQQPSSVVLVLIVAISALAELLLVPGFAAIATGFSERLGAWVLAGYLVITGSLFYTSMGGIFVNQGATGLVVLAGLLILGGAGLLVFRERLASALAEGGEAV